MTIEPAPSPLAPDGSTDALSPTWHRRLNLTGVVFAPFFVIGWVTSVANNPDYTASDLTWTKWAHDNQTKAQNVSFRLSRRRRPISRLLRAQFLEGGGEELSAYRGPRRSVAAARRRKLQTGLARVLGNYDVARFFADLP